MKKFFEEFKKFITRGNVVDMAVGVIVGSSFTAIVNGLSDFILKPIINWLLTLILGKNGLTEIYTFLKKMDADGNVITDDTIPDLTQSIYIDWGAFINAVINFFLIAFVLFTLVKIINTIRDSQLALGNKIIDGIPTKADRKNMKARGIKLGDTEAVTAYMNEKRRVAEEEAARIAAEAAEKARLDREANPTTEDLLKQILEEMKK
jgi:large conductance mechanosensitive channel